MKKRTLTLLLTCLFLFLQGGAALAEIALHDDAIVAQEVVGLKKELSRGESKLAVVRIDSAEDFVYPPGPDGSDYVVEDSLGGRLQTISFTILENFSQRQIPIENSIIQRVGNLRVGERYLVNLEETDYRVSSA